MNYLMRVGWVCLWLQLIPATMLAQQPTLLGEGWSRTFFPDTLDGTVYALATQDADVYVGGFFRNLGGKPDADGIARWDGAQWQTLGSGVEGFVYALLLVGDTLYVAGDFVQAGGVAGTARIAMWDGSAWHTVGGGIGTNFGEVYALAWYNGMLYAGGYFTQAGSTPASNLARWDGQAWHALSPQGPDRAVRALAATDTALFVGGDFVSIENDHRFQYLAAWNETGWKVTGPRSLSNRVFAISFSAAGLFAGGISGIEKFDRQKWVPLHKFQPPIVYALQPVGNNLYAAGQFTAISRSDNGETVALNVARWDGHTWYPLGSGLRQRRLPAASFQLPQEGIFALTAMSSGNLLAGGTIADAGGDTRADRIAMWDGNVWAGLGTPRGHGLNAPVLKVRNGANGIYAFGMFTSAGSEDVSGAAHWDGNKWQSLGLPGDVRDVATSALGEFAVGSFTLPNGASGIAQWDGAAWKRVGAGLTGNVNAVSATAREVCILGAITLEGQQHGAACYHDNAWKTIPAPPSATYVFAHVGDALYAGGDRFVARLDAAGWTDVYTPLGTVYALVGHDDALHVGGYFWQGNIVRCDGSLCTPVGRGLDGGVTGLYSEGGKLYAAGDFYADSNGHTLRFLGVWDGVKWASIGNGAGSETRSVVKRGDHLFVGGRFTDVGSDAVPSHYVASYRLADAVVVEPPSVPVTGNYEFYPNPFRDQLHLTVSFTESTCVWVYNMVGHLVAQTCNPAGAQTITLDTAAWPAGVYIVSMRGSAGETTRTVVRVK